MFGRMVNNFYYGKSGKGDFRKEDLPKNRWQLFFEMLRVRFSGLVKLNLITAVCFLPLMMVLFQTLFTFVSGVSLSSELFMILDEANVVKTAEMTEEAYAQLVTDTLIKAERTADEAQFLLHFNLQDFVRTLLLRLVVFMVPCIAITGPAQAGMSYVTRNWARDEHAFVWADFKDAVKDNWKQALAASVITALVPLVVYVCYVFYGSMAQEKGFFFIIPQMLTLILGVVWMLAAAYIYPMMVSYKAKFGVIFKNSIIMSIARLPHTVGARLAMAVPAIIAGIVFLYTGHGMTAMLILGAYYLLIGNALARFVYASISNAAFDKFINSHMEGVQVNRGLSTEDDDLDDEEDELSENENQTASLPSDHKEN